MVYIPRITFKTGINPSLIRTFPLDGKYTGTQRLLLTQSRIFGNKIGGTHRSGVGEFRKVDDTRMLDYKNKLNFLQWKRFFPKYQNYLQKQYRQILHARMQQKKLKKEAKKKKKK